MKRRLGVMVALFASLTMLFSATALAVHPPTVEKVAGNYRCGDDETKIDPVGVGPYDLAGGGHIHITLLPNKEFAFDTEGTADVSSIVVKGGPYYNIYMFNPTVTSHSGLHAPLNANNGKWYGLSHLCIASDKKD